MYGALLGVQKGRSVEISNSFELLFEKGADEDGVVKLNKEYFMAKEEQCENWQLDTSHLVVFFIQSC